MTGKADAIADVERLAQIRERCDKATPGPWVYDVLARDSDCARRTYIGLRTC